MTIELLNFVGGMILSGFIGLVVFLVSVNRKIKVLNKKQDQIDELKGQMMWDNTTYAREFELIRSHIDTLNEGTHRDIDERINEIHRRIDEVDNKHHRILDMRLDKLEHRINTRNQQQILGE